MTFLERGPSLGQGALHRLPGRVLRLLGFQPETAGGETSRGGRRDGQDRGGGPPGRQPSARTGTRLEAPGAGETGGSGGAEGSTGAVGGTPFAESSGVNSSDSTYG